MLPNVSTLDEDGCGWICLNPYCGGCSAEEIDFLDLIEAGVPERLAVQLGRLLEFYEGQRIAKWGTGRVQPARASVNGDDEPSQHLPWMRTEDGIPIELGQQRRLLLLIGARLRTARNACRDAGELAAALNRDLVVSFTSSEFDVGQETKQGLAILSQLCATVGHGLDDAQDCHAGIDGGLVGLRTSDEL